MGFKSRGQMRRLMEMVHKGEFSKAKFDALLKDTPDMDELPEKVEEALENHLETTKVRDIGNLKYILRSKVVR